MSPKPEGGPAYPWRGRAALGGLMLCVLFLGLARSSTVLAATRTWTGLGATNNWSDTGNWSGNVVPGAADVATFDATSSKNATMNVAVNVGGVSIGAGYGGTITQAAGIAATVGATGWTQAGGTVVGGTAAFTVNGPFAISGGSYSATTATTSVSGNFSDTGGTFNAGTGTVSFGGGAATLTISTADTFNNLTHAAGTKTIAAGTTLTATGTTALTGGAFNGPGAFSAQGNINQASTYAGGTATLTISGAGAQTFTGASTTAAGALPLIVINKPSGTLTIAGTLRTQNNWTYTTGTVDPGTSTLVFVGGTVTGNQTLAAVDVRGTTTIAAGTTLTVSGNLSLTGGTLNTGTVAAQGTISQTSAFANGTATLLINGSGAQTFTGTATTAAGDLPAVVINKASGTLTLAGTLRTTHNWTYTAGIVDPATSTVVFAGTQTIAGSQTLTDVVFNNTTVHTVPATDTLTVAGTLTLADGSIGTGTVAATGDVSQAAAFDGGTGTLAITGAGAQTLTGASTTASGNLPLVVINKPSGTLTLAGTIRTASNWTYTAGALNAGTSTLVFAGGTISGSHTLNAVDLRATTSIAAGTTLTVTGSTTLTAGSLNGTGTLAAQGDVSQALGYGGGAATLAITGAGAQTLTGASTTASGNLPLVVINKPSGTLTLAGTIRTASNWTYTAGALNAGTSTLVFAGGTISGSHTLNAVDLRATTSIAAGTTLTVTGSTTLTAGSLNGTGTLAAQGDVSQALGYGGGAATLAITGAGAQTLTGASTTASGNLPLVVINKPSGTLTLAGTIRTASNWTYTAGALNAGTSTLVFAGGTISGSHTLNAVDLRATTSIAAGTTLTVTGSTTLTAGSLNGTGTLAAQGDVSQALGYGGGAATLAVTGAGAQTLTGASTTASGNLPLVVINKPSGTLTLAGTIRTTHNWTYTAGTVDPGLSLVVLAGSTVSAAGMSFYDVNSSGGTTTLGAAMSIGHDLTVSGGTFTTSASGYGLTIGGSLTVGATLRENGSAVWLAGNLTNNGTIVPGTSTLTFNGTVSQLIGGTVTIPAFNLVVNDPGGVTLAANLTVTGILTLTSGPLTVGPQLLTISNAIAGSATNLVAGLTSSLTITGAGAGIVVPSSVTQLSALTLSNANGVALQVNLAIGGTLTLTTGRLDAGANTVVIGAGGTVVRTGGWVIGQLEKHAAIGSGVGLTFEVGDATAYTPVGVTFATVTGAGDLTVRTTAGDHPDIANSGLAVSRDANRYWTLTNTGIVFDTYSATFTFVAGDLDPGSDTTVFVVAKRDGTTWTRPAVGTRTALSTQATGMTSFSDFAVGQPTADLGVTVDDGVASVVAGDGVTYGYLITVTNAGPSDATTVSLTDAWPTGFSEGTISPSQGTCAPTGLGPDFSCSLGTIGAGTSATVSVAYTVPANTPGGAQVDAVTVASPVVDPSAGDNSASDSTTVIESALLVVTKDDGLVSVIAGTGGHAYVISVTNGGPSDADGLVVDDSVPAALTAGSPIADHAGDCSASVSNTIHCALPASLAPGSTWTISVPYSVGSSVPGQTVTNTATATSDENPGGVPASDATTVTASADLGVSIDDGVASVTAGDGLTYTYTITVTNFGPSDAAAVDLADSWPVGFSRGALPAGCADVGPGPDFTCALGTIAAGGSVSRAITYTVPASTTASPQVDSVTVSSLTADPAPGNDTATDGNTVAMSADLRVTKTASATAVAGTDLTYTISVTNDGPSDNAGYALSDALAAGSAYVTSSGGCAKSAGSVTCSSASLPAGATDLDTITVHIASGYVDGADLANTAAITTTATDDPNSANDSSTAHVTVTASADLGVSIDDGVASVTAGDGLTYTYTITVTNFGPSDAAAVDLADSWPVGFSRGALPAGCADVGPGPDFTCALGTIAAGGSVSRAITYIVPASTTASPQVDSVTVSSLTADPAPGNDTATDGNTVVSASPTPTPSPTKMPAPTSTPGATPSALPGSGVVPDTATDLEPSSVTGGVGLVIVILVTLVVLFRVAPGGRERRG